MKEILLAHSNFFYEDSKQLRKMKPYPPLATLYAASSLKKAGFSVSLFDSTPSRSFRDFERLASRLAPECVVVYEDFFNYIAKMCLTVMREASLRMSQTAKKLGATVIGAGPDINDNPEFYLENGFDYSLRGEPDNSLVELVRWLARTRKGPLSDIPGLAYWDPGGKPRFTGPRQVEKNPDRFAYPAWDLVDMEFYKRSWTEARGYFSMNMVSSRGCPFNCNWCAKPVWGTNYSVRSPENVVREMAMLKERFSPDHIWFVDDIFGGTPGWLEHFRSCLERMKLKIPFTVQSRVDLMTESTAQDLAAAGCVEAWIGVESGSQKILDAMNKGFRVSQVHDAARWLKKNNIKTCFFIQFGYLGEKLEDVMATVDLIRRTRPHDIGISVSYPLPGTRFYQMVADRIGKKTNWRNSEDIAAIFPAEFSTDFYRMLHEVLHREVEFINRLNEPETVSQTRLYEEIGEINHRWFQLGRMAIEPSTGRNV